MEPLSVEAPKGRSNRWTARVGEGQPERVDPGDGGQVRRVARRLGVEPEALTKALQVAILALEADAPQSPEGEESAGEPSVRVWRQGEAPREYPNLREALETEARPDDATYARWEGRDLVAVDVDPAEGQRWTDAEVASLAYAVAPVPRYAWLSRSGGVRAIFTADPVGGLSAMERAALWVVCSPRFCNSTRTSVVEPIAHTRLPQKGTTIRCWQFAYGVRGLRAALLGGVSPDGEVSQGSPEHRDAVLASLGVPRLGRYDHTRCPFDPVECDGNDPVRFLDEVVHCFVCGKRRPYTSWGLSGDLRDTPDPLVCAALHWVHWSHAELIARAEFPRCKLSWLRPAYRALLKVLHDASEEERRISRVFAPRSYLRGVGGWIHREDFAAHKVSRDALRLLPWTGGVFDLMDDAAAPQRLAGYVPIEPVMHLVDSPEWHSSGERILVPRPVPRTAYDEPLTLAEAREEMREVLPGVTDQWLDALRLMVVCGLRAQLGLPQLPMLVLTGGSGAGKGALVSAACGILGAPSRKLAPPKDTAQLSSALGEALESGAPIVLIDEIGKGISWWQQCRPLLEIGAEHTWRKLYVGQVCTPVRSGVVIAGSTLPAALETMPEFARRAALIDLRGLLPAVTERWEAACRNLLQVPRLEDMRRSELGTAIAEAYTADGLESVRVHRSESWVSHALALGASRLEDTERAADQQRTIRALYRLWLDGPDGCLDAGRTVGGKLRRARRPGWLRGWRTGVCDDVAEILDDWIDPDAPRGHRFGRLEELGTCQVPGAPGVRLMVRILGRRVWLRFASSAEPLSLARGDRDLFPDAPE